MDPNGNAPLMNPFPDDAPPPDEDPAGRAARRAVMYGLYSVLALLAAIASLVVFPIPLLAWLVAVVLGAYAIDAGLSALLGPTAGRKRPVIGGLLGLLLGLAPWGLVALPIVMNLHHHEPSSAKSSSNIRQLAVAMTSYAMDYNETLPGWVRNPDGRYAHNVWDEQINGNVKSRYVYNNGRPGIATNGRPGIASPSQPAPRDRVLTYGFNGLLLAPPNSLMDPDWDRATRRPKPWRVKDISDPSRVILLAELEVDKVGRWPGYATPAVLPFTRNKGHSDATGDWLGAIGAAGGGGTIDISPRSWVEPAGYGNVANYQEPYRHAAGRGVARSLYGGGGNYAFCDGHAQFMRIGRTVGMIDANNQPTSLNPESAWAPDNKANMWVPR